MGCVYWAEEIKRSWQRTAWRERERESWRRACAVDVGAGVGVGVVWLGWVELGWTGPDQNQQDSSVQGCRPNHAQPTRCERAWRLQRNRGGSGPERTDKTSSQQPAARSTHCDWYRLLGESWGVDVSVGVGVECERATALNDDPSPAAKHAQNRRRFLSPASPRSHWHHQTARPPNHASVSAQSSS
jgi:hypothetical protein